MRNATQLKTYLINVKQSCPKYILSDRDTFTLTNELYLFGLNSNFHSSFFLID